MDPKYCHSDGEEEDIENTFCFFLHILEGVGFNLKELGDSHRSNQQIVLCVTFNGVTFEVEGQCHELNTIFDSNLIWESNLKNVKRLKMENRPIKIECFAMPGNAAHFAPKQIGTVLLSTRNVPILNNLRIMQDLVWMKLSALNAMWRESKPELHLMLIIVKKSLVASGQIDTFLNRLHSNIADVKTPQSEETLIMLSAQDPIYVQLLEQEGLIQVGNNIDVDNDIFIVSLTFKQLKGLIQFCNTKGSDNSFVFVYNFLGSISKLDIIANAKDVYAINEKITLKLKTSLQSMRIYFQSIFYIPIKVFQNGLLLGTCRFEFEKLLPDDLYFEMHRNCEKTGTFSLMTNKSFNNMNPPLVDYAFSIQLEHVGKKNTSARDICKQDIVNDNKSDFELAPSSSEISRTEHEDKMIDLESNEQEIDKKIVLIESSQQVHVALPKSSRGVLSPKVTQSCSSICEVQEHSKLVTVEETSNAAEVLPEPVLETIIEKKVQIIAIEPIEVTTEGIETLNLNWETTKVQERIQNEGNETCSTQVIEHISLTDKVLEDEEQMQQISNRLEVLNKDEITLCAYKELEEWKLEEQTKFLQELQLKEEDCLNELNREWEERRCVLEEELETKIIKCEELNSKLQKAYNDLKETKENTSQDHYDFDALKHEIEMSYACKFQEIDEKMQSLLADVEQKTKSFEIQNQELNIKNSHLLSQNEKLLEKVRQLEDQVIDLKAQQSQMEEIHSQNIEKLNKSKNYYKSEWIETGRELNRLQLSVLEKEKGHVTHRGQRSRALALKKILDEAAS